jgi:hypothetical protein
MASSSLGDGSYNVPRDVDEIRRDKFRTDLLTKKLCPYCYRQEKSHEDAEKTDFIPHHGIWCAHRIFLIQQTRLSQWNQLWHAVTRPRWTKIQEGGVSIPALSDPRQRVAERNLILFWTNEDNFYRHDERWLLFYTTGSENGYGNTPQCLHCRHLALPFHETLL